ncbi:MAG: hypothetical protein A2Y07_03575 [Planctomycetes bacterium GWF2_50_10]|nr:MAG: hypothetical protein A2Y07_03575 [Planctomycetes bacterium GWF2_50_10]
MIQNTKRHPFKFLSKVTRLLLSRQNGTSLLVEKSYDTISPCYDEAWTAHMRDRSDDLIKRLQLNTHAKVLDLTCGTGYVTNLLSTAAGRQVIGIDRSQGMLAQARKNYAHCEFVQSDILDYLHTAPSESFDIITCCWGLGYSKPLCVLKQVKRVLKKGGTFAVIDNSLFSLFEVLYCSCLAFLENPDALENIMRFRFLAGPRHLQLWLRIAGLKPVHLWQGKKSYTVGSGTLAIERLRSTGAAAGFEYAAKPELAQLVFERFARIIEQKYMRDNRITITHRYLAGIAIK